jgi:hypothetical protein
LNWIWLNNVYFFRDWIPSTEAPDLSCAIRSHLKKSTRSMRYELWSWRGWRWWVALSLTHSKTFQQKVLKQSLN